MCSGCLERSSGKMGAGVHLEWGLPVGQLGWETEPREWPLHLGTLISESVCGCNWLKAHTQREGAHVRALPGTVRRTPGV